MNSVVTKSKLLLKLTQSERLYTTAINPTKLVFSKHGVPSEVLQIEKDVLVEPKQNEVLLKVLASPVNPLDINVIEGKYRYTSQLPSVAGSEAVGEVLSVGSKVLDLKKGDRAVILKMDAGTWRSHLTLPQSDVLKVPKELGIVEAATLTINPCTAYCMLKDFVDLKPGDTLIQNGSNSACGQNVIQLARAWGINTVNVIRPRPNVEQLKNFLLDLGATFVFTEDDLTFTDIFKSGQVRQAKLALDCIGGHSSSGLLRFLQNSGKMVVYGGMSKTPVSIPVSALIFKNIHICGFAISQWMEENGRNEQWNNMFNELISLMIRGDLKAPVHKFVDVDNYKEAVTSTITEKGMVGKKYLLSFNK